MRVLFGHPRSYAHQELVNWLSCVGIQFVIRIDWVGHIAKDIYTPMPSEIMLVYTHTHTNQHAYVHTHTHTHTNFFQHGGECYKFLYTYLLGLSVCLFV